MELEFTRAPDGYLLLLALCPEVAARDDRFGDRGGEYE